MEWVDNILQSLGLDRDALWAIGAVALWLAWTRGLGWIVDLVGWSGGYFQRRANKQALEDALIEAEQRRVVNRERERMNEELRRIRQASNEARRIRNEIVSDGDIFRPRIEWYDDVEVGDYILRPGNYRVYQVVSIQNGAIVARETTARNAMNAGTVIHTPVSQSVYDRRTQLANERERDLARMRSMLMTPPQRDIFGTWDMGPGIYPSNRKPEVKAKTNEIEEVPTETKRRVKAS